MAFDYLKDLMQGYKQTPGEPTYQPRAFKRSAYPGAGQIPAAGQQTPTPQQTPMNIYASNRTVANTTPVGRQTTAWHPLVDLNLGGSTKDIALPPFSAIKPEVLGTTLGGNTITGGASITQPIDTNAINTPPPAPVVTPPVVTQPPAPVVTPPTEKTDFDKALELYQANLLSGMRGESPAIDRARKGAERDDAMAEYESINAAKSAAVRAGYEPGTAQYNEMVRNAQDKASAFRQESMRGINDMRLKQQQDAQSNVRTERAYNDTKKLTEKADLNGMLSNAGNNIRVKNQIQKAWDDAGGDVNKFRENLYRDVVNADGSYKDPGASESVNATKASLDEFASTYGSKDPRWIKADGSPMSWEEATKAGLINEDIQKEAYEYSKQQIAVTRQGVKEGQEAIDAKAEANSRYSDVLSGKADISTLKPNDWDYIDKNEIADLIYKGKIISMDRPNASGINPAKDMKGGSILEKDGVLYIVSQPLTVDMKGTKAIVTIKGSPVKGGGVIDIFNSDEG